jgi:hypothetical protein
MLGIEPVARGPSTRRLAGGRNREPGSVSIGAWTVRWNPGVDPGEPSCPDGNGEMTFQVTVRFGRDRQRYHQTTVEARDLRDALAQVAASLPDEVAAEADLAEIRPWVDPEDR